MAEPATSDSSPDTDRDFDPSAEMLISEYDDERTLDEEEAMSSEGSNELSDLQKEGDMPLEELLAMYGYGNSGAQAPEGSPPEGSEPHDTRSSSEEEILSNQDLTLDKDEIARDLLKNDDHDKETSVNELLDSVDMPSQTVRLLRSSNSQGGSSDDEESVDYDYVPDDDWKKVINVGSSYQAQIPDGLCKYGDAPAYENEDRLLWDPYKLDDCSIESYMKEVHKQNQMAAQGVHAVPTGVHTRDDEQALYLLLQCGHNKEEALRRRKMQAVPPTDPMSLWSEEECRNFENGLRQYGKDFYLIQQNKVRTRSVGELVQFYYLWKKTERHDVFANKTRLEKKKYVLHPGVTDYMDRFLDHEENPPPPNRDRSASPIHSLIYGDPKRHSISSLGDLKDSSEDLKAAFEMVTKVVDPDKVFSEIKLNPELQTGSPTMPTVSISTEVRDNQQSPENLVHIANFTSTTATTTTVTTTNTTSTTTLTHPPPNRADETANGLEPSPKRLKTNDASSPSECTVNKSPSEGSAGGSEPAVPTGHASHGEKTVTCSPPPHSNSPPKTALLSVDCDTTNNHHVVAVPSNVEVSISSVNSVHPSLADSGLGAPLPSEKTAAESIAQ